MKIAISQMISNEHRYIKEWLDYHLNTIKIDHIFLYEDVCSESHKEICDQFHNVTLYNMEEHISDKYLKEIIENNLYIQTAVLKQSIDDLKDEYDWLLFIDVDEFIDHHPIDVISKHSDASVISIKNYTMTCSDALENPEYDYSVVSKYDIKSEYMAYYYKCLFNLKHELFKDGMKFIPKQCPHFITDDDVVAEENETHHYLFKSWPEWIDRLLHKGAIVDRFWKKQLDEFFDLNIKYADQKEQLISKLYEDIPDFEVNLSPEQIRNKLFKKIIEQNEVTHTIHK